MPPSREIVVTYKGGRGEEGQGSTDAGAAPTAKLTTWVLLTLIINNRKTLN